jgi:hypothetical protein
MRLSAALKVTGAAVFATALNNPSPVSLSSKDGTKKKYTFFAFSVCERFRYCVRLRDRS